MLSRRARLLLLLVIYASAGYQFLRYYVLYPVFYLNLPAYLAGHERLPFQARVLPVLFLKPLLSSHLAQRLAEGRVGPLQEPGRMAFFLLSILALAAVVFFCMQLYNALTTTRRLAFLVFPVLLSTLLWTYVLHPEANFSYPYDLLSLAFFTAGIDAIYRRRFLPLLLIMVVGTLNRETTLFLVGIFLLDAASVDVASSIAPLRDRFRPSQIPWARVALLLVLWTAIELGLAHTFAGNDRTEVYNRAPENLVRLINPHFWAAYLNVCGYLIPFVILFRSRILPQRFGNYVYILIPWFAVMFFRGVIFETRIYGELCAFAAVAMVLLFEDSIAGKQDQPLPT